MFSALRIHMSENAYDEVKAFPEFITVPRGEIFVKVFHPILYIRKQGR